MQCRPQQQVTATGTLQLSPQPQSQRSRRQTRPKLGILIAAPSTPKPFGAVPLSPVRSTSHCLIPTLSTKWMKRALMTEQHINISRIFKSMKRISMSIPRDHCGRRTAARRPILMAALQRVIRQHTWTSVASMYGFSLSHRAKNQGPFPPWTSTISSS